MRAQGKARKWAWCALLVGAVGIVGMATVGYQAYAQSDGESPDESGDSALAADPGDTPLVPLPQRDHFQPYPMGEGAWQYEDQAPEVQAMIDAADEWGARATANGVHTDYSRARTWSVEYAHKVRAQREAGLVGAEDLGVE